MTFIRRVAVTISGVMVRYAASGCREWAEGLAREVEFVEGDWAALGWAIGSLRVLLDRREAVAGSIGEAVEMARRFGKTQDWQRDRLVPVLMLIQAVAGLCTMFTHSVEWRTARLLVIMVTYLGFELLGLRWKISFSPKESDALSWIVYYRRELARMSGSSGFMFVRFFLMYGMFLASQLLAHGGGLRVRTAFSAVTGTMFLGAFLFAVWRRMQFRRQVTALDAMLREMEV